jgi:hypothetical protein
MLFGPRKGLFFAGGGAVFARGGVCKEVVFAGGCVCKDRGVFERGGVQVGCWGVVMCK